MGKPQNNPAIALTRSTSLPAAVFILTVATLALCGCQTPKRSKAWTAATSTKIPGYGDATQSETFAKELHNQLNAKGIENKVVTYSYSSTDKLSQTPVVHTQSAVVYRNEESPNYPWWLMDNMHSAPVWLPNKPLTEQVQFAEQQHEAQVIAVNGAAPGPVSESTPPAVAEGPKEKETDWERLFKHEHGTTYDSHSSLDRKKMAALKETKLEARKDSPHHKPRVKSSDEPATESPTKQTRIESSSSPQKHPKSPSTALKTSGSLTNATVSADTVFQPSATLMKQPALDRVCGYLSMPATSQLDRAFNVHLTEFTKCAVSLSSTMELGKIPVRPARNSVPSRHGIG